MMIKPRITVIVVIICINCNYSNSYSNNKKESLCNCALPSLLLNRFHLEKPGQRVAGSDLHPCMGICCKSGYPLDVYRMDYRA